MNVRCRVKTLAGNMYQGDWAECSQEEIVQANEAIKSVFTSNNAYVTINIEGEEYIFPRSAIEYVRLVVQK